MNEISQATYVCGSCDEHVSANVPSASEEEILRQLLDRIRLETQRLAWWWAIQEACGSIVGAGRTEFYVYEPYKRRLRRIERTPENSEKLSPFQLAGSVSASSQHPLGAAVRGQQITEWIGPETQYHLVVPIHGRSTNGHDNTPFGAVVLHCRAATAVERQSIRSRTETFTKRIWPLSTYARLRDQLTIQGLLRRDSSDARDLDRILQFVMEFLCRGLGFEFALISLCDEPSWEGAEREVRARAGWNAPWWPEAHHLLSSADITADVVRSGRLEVISGWDDRFDKRIYEQYGHEHLTRVFVPLGTIGTLEAGLRGLITNDIDRLLINVVSRLASDVTILIQNALLSDKYRTEQAYGNALEKLHRVTSQLRTREEDWDETHLLRDIAEAARDVLNASIVLLYPLEPLTGEVGVPIIAGDTRGEKRLRSPNREGNIVSRIAATREPYYSSNVLEDKLFLGTDDAAVGGRSFAVRQGIRSFAGVPLIARGTLLGVLCVNYRTEGGFEAPHAKRRMELVDVFAQQASSVIASGQLAREQERNRLEAELHNVVKSAILAVLNQCRDASQAIRDNDLDGVQGHLEDLERAAQGILSDVQIMLSGLPADRFEKHRLHDLIHEDLRRLLGHRQSRLRVDLDESLPSLPVALTRSLLALLREAVINAIEHSQGRNIIISAGRHRGWLWLRVVDNGTGLAMPEHSSNHHGRTYMQRQIDRIGGRLTVKSSRQHGTLVRFIIPLPEGGLK